MVYDDFRNSHFNNKFLGYKFVLCEEVLALVIECVLI